MELPLSPPARAAPPSGPRRFRARLPAWERKCQWALTKKGNALGIAAHFRLVISVSFRTAASAEAPLSPMRLPQRLCQARGGMGMVREQACQWALTGTVSGSSGGALQRGQAPARWETCSESHDPGEVVHFDVLILVRRLADRHLATLISHLGSDLEGRALYLALVNITHLTQVVARETVWEGEHASEFQSRLRACVCRASAVLAR